MAEVLHQDTRTNAFGNSPGLNPTKRRPPKLKRRVSPKTSSDRQDRPAQYQFGQGTRDQGFFNSIRPVVEEYPHTKSESDGPSSADTSYSIPAPERSRESKGKRAIVLEREVESSPESSPQNTQVTNQEQQLIQLDDVGNTVNGAGDLVREVGTKTAETVGQTARGVVGTVGNAAAVQGKRTESEQLRLRLDLNLDVEVQLKAKIHGDLTLQLLN
ncbi:hypothetical protein BDV12DRAFT_178970 [Aspergillus spectabilis]